MTTLTRRGALGLMGGAAALPMLGSPAIAANKLNIAALNFTSHAASFIAFERGYFADEGFDVDFKFFQAAQPMAVAIASGDADYAVTAISGGLISLAEKGAVKVIGGSLSEEPGIDGQKILASDAAFQAGLTSAAMLDGKKFGITQAGSSFHYMGAKIAAAEGATMDYVPLQKVGSVIGALKTGQIDAWTIVPHIAKPLAAGPEVHIIGDVADYLPDYQVTTIFTSQTNAGEERAKTEAVLRALSKGAEDFNMALIDKTTSEDEMEEMVKLIHKYVNADQPYDKARGSIVNGAMRLNAGAALNTTSVKDQLDWFIAEGLVKDSISMDMLVDTSYVQTM